MKIIVFIDHFSLTSKSIRNYYRFVKIIENEIKEECPLIEKIKWLIDYSSLNKINYERLKSEIFDFDFILLIWDSAEAIMSLEIVNILAESKKKIVKTIPELIEYYNQKTTNN
jgi:hypothetical protein